MNHPGFMEVDMGQKVGRYPIDKIKFSSSKRELLTFLSPKPMVTKTHYHEDLGNFYYSDTAVEHGLDIKVKYNFIAIRWEADSKGRLQSADEWELVIVSLSGKDYEALTVKAELNGSLNKHMILVICENEQYQNVTMEMAGAAPHTQNKKLAAAVKAEYKRVKPFVPQVIAVLHSEAKVAEKLGPVQGSADYQKLEARQHTAIGAGDDADPLLLDDGDDDFGFDGDTAEEEKPKKAAKKTAKKTAKKAPKKVEEEIIEEDDMEEVEDDDQEDATSTDEDDDDSFDFEDDEDFD